MDNAWQDIAEPAGYPAEREFDGLLRNGEAVIIRPIWPTDAPVLVGLHGAVSPGRLHQHVLLAQPGDGRSVQPGGLRRPDGLRGAGLGGVGRAGQL